jgi:hypothetical protein
MKRIRDKRISKPIAIMMVLLFLQDIIIPNQLFARPGGPGQPEAHGFQAAGTTDLVDPFTGDFSYTIPLIDIGGYPISIGYQSGITMDQDASWVGLGWNLSPGAITRQMRGLPDDFNGDNVIKEYHVKKNWTVGATVKGDFELFGLEFAKIGVGIGVNYNSYTGIGFEQTIDGRISEPGIAKSNMSGRMQLGLSLRSSSNDGLSISPSLSLSQRYNENEQKSHLGVTIGISSNSREGLKAMSFSGADLSGGYSLQPNTYMPKINWPYKNHSFSFSGKLGAELIGSKIPITLSGYYTEQLPDQEIMSLPSYGYFHTESGQFKRNALLDFNRDGEMPYSKFTKHLPLTNYTYDLYQVAAQGIGGSFRAYRNELSMVHDNTATNRSSSGSLGGEIGVGNLFGTGLDISYSPTKSESGFWSNNNQLLTAFGNQFSTPLDYEPYFLRFTNEFVPESDATYFGQQGELDPVRVELENTGDKFTKVAAPKLFANNSTTINLDVTNGVNAQNRRIRNQIITAVTAGEAAVYGFAKYSSKYAANHHIAEYIITRGDGSRYIFGHAAYNKSQIECTFNVSKRTGNCDNGLVTYETGDDSPANKQGRDHLYTSTITPAYAHSYMLSGVLSTDYVDVTNDGMSEDDLGWYTKFNYSPQEDLFKWRTPALANTANFDEGLKSDPLDNKGHYVYGEKELLYLESIETKTQVAIFEISDRDDMPSVNGRQGGAGSSYMQKLDAIKLYSKPEYDADPENAVPLQTIYFTYDYSLCQNLPNHVTTGEGKLTLKEISITYRDSDKGHKQRYAFHYGDNNHDGLVINNPDYHPKGFDRWGNYMPSSGNCKATLSGQTAAEFPYTDQTNADTYASAWALTSIDMPTGGRLEVTYESDDYGYVQDKPAMQMVKIAGFSSNHTGTPVNTLYDLGSSNHRFFVIVDIPTSVGNASELKEKYFGNKLAQGNILKGTMYYRVLTRLGINDNTYEYVSGYAEIDSVYYVNGTRAAIELKAIKTGDRGVSNYDVNPITRTAWQFAQTYNPHVAFGFGDPPSAAANEINVAQILKELAKASIIQNILEYIKGANSVMADKGFCRETIPAKSFVRLYSPSGTKKGGGSRVKEILYHDNWDDMVTYGSDFALGQRYRYTLENGKSSGVAAFEPMIGADENPLRQPLYQNYAELTASDMKHYQEYPIGSSFYPGPVVGYSRVVIEDFSSNETNVRGKTGKTVQEFYTAKDFPVRARATSMEALPAKSGLGGQLLGQNVRDYMYTSQGFVVETNDMHGKPKATTIYGQDQTTFISRMEYFYKEGAVQVSKMQPAGSGDYIVRSLNNEVQTIKSDGTLSAQTIGVNVDIVNDFSAFKDESETHTIQGNLGTFLIGFLPGGYVIPYPWITRYTTSYNTVVTTKVIQRAGVIDHVVAYDAGSRIETKNLAWDAETGEVLVTETQNMYDDPVYQFNYPAHWAYNGMGQAYKNIGLTGQMSTNSSGLIDIAGTNNEASYLVPGDEVIIGPNKGWVIDNATTTDNNLYLVNASGDVINTSSGNQYFKIERSGRRNQQAIAIGSLTMKVNPLSNLSSGKINITASHELLNASAQEFTENWKGQQFWQLKGIPEYFSVMQIEYFNALLQQNGGILTNGQFVSITIPGMSAPSTFISQVQHACPDFKIKIFEEILLNQLLIGYQSSCFGGGVAPVCSKILFEDPAPTIPPNWTDLSFLDPESIDITVAPWKNGTPDTVEVMWSMKVDGYFNGYSSNPVRLVIEYGDCYWNYQNNEFYGRLNYECLPLEDSVVNPYQNGIRGIWRPLKSNTFLTERTQSSTSNNMNLREDGVFEDFISFWNPPTTGNIWSKNSSGWTWVNEATKANQYGEQLEAKDALERYSSALYGYHHKLSTAVAGNARYTEIAFDGFEDYDYYSQEACPVHHFNFYEFYSNLSSVESHTGKYSLKIPSEQSVSVYRDENDISPTPTSNDVPYTIKSDDKNGVFGPYSNTEQSFLLSLWVKEIHSGNVFDYDFNLDVKISGTALNLQPVSKSPIIDGWQQVNYIIDVTSQSNPSFELLISSPSDKDLYIDDLRIIPVKGSMKSYVYHPGTLLLAAELDENNYATLYEYDREGKLIRVKKETEKGIVTIQEVRTGIAGQP